MILLDTHVILWAFSDENRLSSAAKSAISLNDLALSMVSLWEMAIKASLPREERRLVLDRSIPEFLELCEKEGIKILSVTAQDCERIRQLSHHHEDPFDRMIIAQAATRSIPIVTKDENIQKYEEIHTIW